MRTNVLELKIPPLLLLMITAAAMWGLGAVLPAWQLPFDHAPWVVGGLVGAGGLIALLGVLEFRRKQTTVDPRYPQNTARLVVSGVYRFTRNPMYLGFLLILAGWACYLAHTLAFLLMVVFVVYMNRFQIRPEERFMQSKFGAEYDAYRASVRRWI